MSTYESLNEEDCMDIVEKLTLSLDEFEETVTTELQQQSAAIQSAKFRVLELLEELRSHNVS